MVPTVVPVVWVKVVMRLVNGVVVVEEDTMEEVPVDGSLICSLVEEVSELRN